MGLAASQVRLLTLTSDKLSMEKQIMINTNRKMALTAEMSRLAFEKNSRLNQYQYQVSTINNGLQEISYEYLMGKSGGVQDIETKSEDKMMLFESSTGRVVLSEDMAAKIGDISLLRANQNEKYKAIARLCGDTHLTIPENLPSNIDLNFCADPDLVKAICGGKYNSYSVNDLTSAISKYQLCAYATDGSDVNGNIIPAFQAYLNSESQPFGYLNTVENIYGDPTLLGDKYYPEINGVPGNVPFSWAHAYQISSDSEIHYWDGSSDASNNSVNNKVVNVGTLSANNYESKRELLTKVVTSFAESYSKQSNISMLKLSDSINKTVNEFLSNLSDINVSDHDETQIITESYYEEGDNNNLVRTNYLSTIRYRDVAVNPNDSKRLCAFMGTNDNDVNKFDMFIDVSALATYFHAAVLGEGIGYTSKSGMDEFLFDAPQKADGTYSSSDGANTPVLYHDKFEENGKWKDYGIQKFVPAGVNSDQWIESFNKLISDVKFYYPIVEACIKFGCTTGYDDLIKKDPSYVDESLQNGTFQIMDFDASTCSLDGSHNTKYYLMFSEIFKTDNESQKLEVQAWYKKEKASIKHKEDVLDTIIDQMNTELNSINTEIESIKTYIDDSKRKFQWCNG